MIEKIICAQIKPRCREVRRSRLKFSERKIQTERRRGGYIYVSMYVLFNTLLLLLYRY